MAALVGTIQVRKDTAANWTLNNPTLLNGEFGFETDTKKIKVGDGTTLWNALAYITTWGPSLTGYIQDGDTLTLGLTAPNDGLKALDTGGDHVLALVPNENLTANRRIFLVVNNANRTLTIPADATISGTNTGDQTSVTGNAGTATALQTSRNIDGQAFDGTANITVIAPGTNAAASKATPVDADELPLVDSAASNVLKKLTWANLKATVKTYFDTLYISQSFVAAKGDIIGASANDTPAITSVGTDGQVLMANSANASGLGYGYAPSLIPIVPVVQGTLLTWTNMPSALTFFNAQGRWFIPVDLTNRTRVRIVTIMFTTAASANAKLRLLYRTQASNYDSTVGNWLTLGSSEVEVTLGTSINTFVSSAWIDIVAGAKTTSLVVLAGIDGNGAADPVFAGVWMEVE